MMITIGLLEEEGYWVARCFECMISETGESKEAAMKNLLRTLEELAKQHPLKKVDRSRVDKKGWEIVEKEVDLQLA